MKSVLLTPVLVFVLVAAASAATTSHMMGYEIQTNDSTFNLKSSDFVFPVKVKFSKPGTNIVADKAHGNSARKFATFDGNVVLHSTGGLPVGGREASKSGTEPSTLTSDKLDVDGVRKFYAASGRVHFTQGDKVALADRGTLDDQTHILHLEGSVHVGRGEQTMDGNAIDYNIDSGESHAVGNPVTMKAPEPPSTSHLMGYEIQSNDSDFNLKSTDFVFPVRVKFSKPGTDIVADRAHGNSERKLAFFDGNVVLHSTGALPVGGREASKAGSEASTLTSDKLDVDGVRKFYAASGHVHFTQADKFANAEKGTLDDQTHILHLEGSVHVGRGGQTMDGDKIDYNVDSGEAHAVGSPVIMKAPIPPPSPSVLPTKAPKKKS